MLAISCKCSLQEILLAGFGIRDLVDDNANSAFRDNVGRTVAQLDGHHCFCRRNSEHWEQIHDRICAPADHRHNLRCANLLCDFWVRFGGGCSCKANEELVDDVQEERHGGKPADPPGCEVASDNKLTVVARCDHEGGAEAESPCPRVEVVCLQFHHQQNLDQEQWYSQKPIHVAIGGVERHKARDIDGALVLLMYPM